MLVLLGLQVLLPLQRAIYQLLAVLALVLLPPQLFAGSAARQCDSALLNVKKGLLDQVLIIGKVFNLKDFDTQILEPRGKPFKLVTGVLECFGLQFLNALAEDILAFARDPLLSKEKQLLSVGVLEAVVELLVANTLQNALFKVVRRQRIEQLERFSQSALPDHVLDALINFGLQRGFVRFHLNEHRGVPQLLDALLLLEESKQRVYQFASVVWVQEIS